MADKQTFCFNCKDFKIYKGQPTDASVPKQVPSNDLTDQPCFSCTAEVNLLSMVIRVTGPNHEEVKVVTGFLVEKVGSIIYEKNKKKT